MYKQQAQFLKLLEKRDYSSRELCEKFRMADKYDLYNKFFSDTVFMSYVVRTLGDDHDSYAISESGRSALHEYRRLGGADARSWIAIGLSALSVFVSAFVAFFK